MRTEAYSGGDGAWGSNPCIVEPDIPVKTSVQRIAWGKYFNAGQTCIAPNICYVHKKIGNEFIDVFKGVINEFYGPNPCSSPSLCRIVNRVHFERIKSLVLSSRGQVITGGSFDDARLRISPTLIKIEKTEGEALLTEEIFGPVLPILFYNDIEDVLFTIRQRPSPLAIFLFTKNSKTHRLVRARTISGNLFINGTLHLIISTNLPFGGVGGSGFGRYHGKAGFEAFSYRRSEVKKPFFPDFKFMYPPYKTPMWFAKRAINSLFTNFW